MIARVWDLDMPGNHLGDAAMVTLAHALSETVLRLQSLHLANNSIKERGAEILAQCLLEKHNTLGLLVLAGNAIGDNGSSAILGAVAGAQSPVHTLRLDACGLTDNVARALAALIRARTSLRALSISRNRLGDDTTVAISRALDNRQRVEGITELDLSDNWLGADSAVALAALLLNDKALLRLNISGNSSLMTAPRAVTAFADGISRNRALLEIDLSRCNLFPNTARLFCFSARANVQIDFIFLNHDNRFLGNQIQTRSCFGARSRADELHARLVNGALSHAVGNLIQEPSPSADQSNMVCISYGRKPNIIGGIQCCTSTSLAEMRSRIDSQLRLSDSCYRILARDGTRAFPRHEEDKRHVLADCGNYLQLRPSTWLKLSNADQEVM
mmetsp:Transcript_4672/g.14905  ORF Transcript_4672/g.14905 Transcript_4672/m.14905 type:complete len:387 (+) Transcript_4672:144-1304(+)